MTPDLELLADELSNLFGRGKERKRLTETVPDLDLRTAYQIGDAVRRQREAKGDSQIGRKIGFTNYRMWEVYEVKAPIWGPIYEGSVGLLHADNTLSLSGFPNPRIEPEIVFGLGRAPRPGMDESDLAECIDWVAMGFELVSSIFPEWKFKAADAVAGFGLHAALVVGQSQSMSSIASWADQLASFSVALRRDGELVAKGRGSDVLGSPLTALRHLNDLLADPAFGSPLAEGEMITTGTLTLAMPVAPDETWTAEPFGIDLEAISVRTS